jgi:hypothetical protein
MVSNNPFIIREQAYQEEMTKCVRQMLNEFQVEDDGMATLF